MYRTIHPIPTFTRVLFCPLFYNLPQNPSLGVFFGAMKVTAERFRSLIFFFGRIYTISSIHKISLRSRVIITGVM